MTLRLKILILPIIAIFVLACKGNPHGGGDDDGNGGNKLPPGVQPALVIADARVTPAGEFHVQAAAATEYIDIRTNIGNWTVSVADGATWVSAEAWREPPVTATGVEVVQKLTLTIGENLGTASRTATVRLSGAGVERTLRVVQTAPTVHTINFTSPVFAAAAGETLDIAITANVGWIATIPEGCDWLEEVAEPMLPDGILRLRAAANVGATMRSAEVEVTAVGVAHLRRSLVVEQQGSAPALDVAGPAEITVVWNVRDLALGVTANVAYRTEIFHEGGHAEWMWHSAHEDETTTGAATRDERFVVNDNMAATARSARVRFISDDPAALPAIVREVKVTQSGYELPPPDVFELFSGDSHALSHSSQIVSIGIVTGLSPDAIALGGVGGWLVQAGDAERTHDMLTYRFEVAANVHPLTRMRNLIFTAGSGTSSGKTLEVSVRQDAALDALPLVEYSSLAGGNGSYALLFDCDTDTHVLGNVSAGWTFGLRRPAANEFNTLTYHPVVGRADLRIAQFELLACTNAHGTWYSVASGHVPASFYSDAAVMSRGFRVTFPTVRNARQFMLRVRSVHGGGSAFGASEIHLAYDYTKNVAASPTLAIDTPSPVAVGAASGEVTLDVTATVPYSVDSSVLWLAHDETRAAPGRLTFVFAANPDAEQRSAVIALRATTGGLERTLTVVQAANTATLEFAAPAGGVVNLQSPDSEAFEVEVTTNLAASEVSVAGLPSWLALEEKSGAVRFRFRATANDGAARSHAIVFAGGGRSLTLTVNQPARPDAVPTLFPAYPVSGEITLDAAAAPFEVVLKTNMSPSDIGVSALPEWLTTGIPVHGDGTATFPFTAASNSGDQRTTTLTFHIAAKPELSVAVTVRQLASSLPGIPVTASGAIYYDLAMNRFDAFETVDGDRSTYHSVDAGTIWAYEFSFASDTDLAGVVYCPRDSDTEHGTLRRVRIEVVNRPGGVAVAPFEVEIPPSVYSTSEGRRTGWRIDFPHTAVSVSHVRLRVLEGYQSRWSIAEMEFFAPNAGVE
ncbi:MAG: hypothetical protein FWE10_01730 [Rikenellaceae bacterium]|nr:hypothetical protein [Rikenellaceae bacterium]MCL2692545.1 hypothetical protein [Rikenellaceae bacterium]